MNNPNAPLSLSSPEVYRNMGFWDEPTQQAILDTHVAIGGTGGAGYLYGLEMASIGVQNFSIADPEGFERVNGNRVLGVNEDTLGRNKSEVFAEEIQKRNKGANITIFSEGINADNIEKFMYGAHLVLDATELSMPELGTMVARQARRNKIPVLNVEYVGHGAQVTSFDPESKITFERFMGLDVDTNLHLSEYDEKAMLERIAKETIATNRYLAYIPKYGDLKTLMAIEKGASLPSNMIGAGTAAQLGLGESIKHIRQRAGIKTLTPTFAPEVRWYDSYNGVAGHTRHPRFSYTKHLLSAVVRNQLGLNEDASYTVEERAARGDVD